jgi:hypothetical protein
LVSTLMPQVSITVQPLPGAVHVYQTSWSIVVMP